MTVLHSCRAFVIVTLDIGDIGRMARGQRWADAGRVRIAIRRCPGNAAYALRDQKATSPIHVITPAANLLLTNVP